MEKVYFYNYTAAYDSKGNKKYMIIDKYENLKRWLRKPKHISKIIKQDLNTYYSIEIKNLNSDEIIEIMKKLNNVNNEVLWVSIKNCVISSIESLECIYSLKLYECEFEKNELMINLNTSSILMSNCKNVPVLILPNSVDYISVHDSIFCSTELSKIIKNNTNVSELWLANTNIKTINSLFNYNKPLKIESNSFIQLKHMEPTLTIKFRIYNCDINKWFNNIDLLSFENILSKTFNNIKCFALAKKIFITEEEDMTAIIINKTDEILFKKSKII